MRIRELMNKRGLTTSSLAVRVKTTQSNISNIINKKANPSLLMLKRIASALEVDITELFQDNNNNNNNNDNSINVTCPHCNNHINIDISKR